jgi:hypothetical protein
MDGAGFAFREDQDCLNHDYLNNDTSTTIASVSMQANRDYSTLNLPD